MKKLLYIANLRLPTEKAYGIQIAKMCEAFADFGLEVTLIYPKRNNPSIKEDIFDYYSVKRNFKFKRIWSPDFYWLGRLDKIAVNIKGVISALNLFFYALTQKADIIYSRDEWPLYFLSFFKKNLVFEAHRFSKSRGLFYKRFKNKNFKIVVITKFLKEDFVKIGFKSEYVWIAPDGVDLEEFKIQTSKEEAKKRFDLPWNKKIAVYIGHLYPWKGVDILLEVAKYLHEINVNYLILIFGGTKKDVGDFELKIHPSVRYLIKAKGMIPHQKVAHILKAADCAILTGNESDVISAKYTSPLKMFEYMASGCPIVAQNLPSFREVLNDTNSFLVKPGDAKDLADKISEVFENENVAQEKATKALEDVQNYTWQKRAISILNFLD